MAEQFCAYRFANSSMVLVGRIRAQDAKKARRQIRLRWPSATHYAKRGDDPAPVARQSSAPTDKGEA